MSRRLLIATALVPFIFSASASEIDSFTLREKVQLQDALEIMNQLTNEGLDKAMAKANRRGGDEVEDEDEVEVASDEENLNEDAEEANDNEQPSISCDEQRLRKKIFDALAKGALWSKIEIKANNLGDEYALRVKRKESIYNSFTFFESIPLFTYGLGKTVSINGYSIGSDKFGHFFHEGMSYWKKVNAEEGVEAALEFGVMTEKTYYGLQGTGVYSYGDLVANFNGMRFWMALIEAEQSADVLGVSVAPYFRCENNQWVKLRNFDWSEYIDAGWDEAINCSAYRPKQEKFILEEILQRVLTMKNAKNVSCPLLPQSCEELKVKYGAYAESILHPACFKGSSSF